MANFGLIHISLLTLFHIICSPQLQINAALKQRVSINLKKQMHELQRLDPEQVVLCQIRACPLAIKIHLDCHGLNLQLRYKLYLEHFITKLKDKMGSW